MNIFLLQFYPQSICYLGLQRLSLQTPNISERPTSPSPPPTTTHPSPIQPSPPFVMLLPLPMHLPIQNGLHLEASKWFTFRSF